MFLTPKSEQDGSGFTDFNYDYRDQVTEKLEHVTPTVSVKTYGSLGNLF